MSSVSAISSPIPEQVASSPTTAVPDGDFETLFQMLEELGPAPQNYMLGLTDPFLEKEDIFEFEEGY